MVPPSEPQPEPAAAPSDPTSAQPAQDAPDEPEHVAEGGASAGGVSAGRGGSYTEGDQAASVTSAGSSAGNFPAETAYEGQPMGGNATHVSGSSPATPGKALSPDDII